MLLNNQTCHLVFAGPLMTRNQKLGDDLDLLGIWGQRV